MKKTILLTVLAMALSFMGMAQEWYGITSDSPAKMQKTLVSSTENEIIVDVQIDGFYTKKVETPKGSQVIISYDKMASMLEAGAPDLPLANIPTIIGDRAEMKVSVVKSSYVDIEGIEVAPSKGNFSRQIDPEDVPYTYGAMYEQDAFWPATQVYLEKPYILRDFRGQNIMVRPFAYNPVTKTLRVYTSMTIAMTKVSDRGENQKTIRRGNTVKVDPEQKAQYDRRFINFGETGAKYQFDEDFGEMLIVCADMYMSNLQPLVEWKNKSGRPTTLVSVTQAGGNNAQNIKNYISSVYNDPDHNLEFVLLVGEYNDLTPYLVASGKRSDNWFGKLEGNDDYLDVLVGRLSVSDANDATLQVNKIIYYERDVQAGASWANKGMGIGYYGAGSGHYGEDDYQHIDYIRDTLMHYTYANVTEHHGGSGGDASVSTISGTINSGIGIINYCNHGSVTSWGVANYSVSNVMALTNDYKLPIVWSVACLNGQFDTGTCFGESWMRAKNNSNGNPTGAVGGMFSWISQPWIPPMYGQDEMVEILCGWVGGDQFNHTLGGASLNGSMDILDKAPGDSYQTFNTWLLFGDPSMMVRTDIPTAINVTTSPSQLMTGMTSLDINANAEYGIATLSMNDETIASGKVINGACTLTFPALATVGTADLVVMGYNKVTYIGTVDIIAAEGAFITVDSYNPAIVPTNESQLMSITVKNVGVEATTTNTTVTLSSNNENITFTDNTGSFGPLAVNATATMTDEFAFTVAQGVPDNTVIPISFTATNGDDSWTEELNITVGAPVIEFAQMDYAGGFVPGETQTVTAVFHNNGHYHATNAVVTASTTSTHVTFADDTFTIGEIGVDEDGTATFDVTIDEACPETEVIEITFDLTADNGVTATGTGVMANTCVIVFSLHDSYGDGWNGCKLVVAYSDGTPNDEMTVASGSDAEYVKEISIGTIVTVSFVPGSYAYECSFTIAYQDGDQIYASSGTPATGQVCQFLVNCGGGVIIETYEITVTVNPEGAGTVTGAGSYQTGEECVLIASPSSDYVFANWMVDGEVIATDMTYSFNVTESLDIVANFELFEGVIIGEGTATNDNLPSYSYYKYGMSQQIYTAAEIGMTGEITSIGFYNGGAEKTRSYDIYMMLTDKNEFTNPLDWINATADALVFSGTVTMAANAWTTMSLTTPFVYDGSANLVITMDDNTGSYTNAPHMSCRVFETSNSQAIYAYNDSYNLNPLIPSVTGTTIAVKNQIRMGISSLGEMYQVTVTAEPAQGGAVTGGGTYLEGATATITATANEDYEFVYWTVDNEVVSTNPSYTFTVTEDVDFIAYFEFTYVPPVPTTYEIVVVADPEGYGVALGGGTYEEGESCTVTAEAFEGFEFINWTEDGLVISDNPVYTFTVNAERWMVAHFEEVPPITPVYNITLSSDIECGVLSGMGEYEEGQECTVSINTDYCFDIYFICWMENGQIVSYDQEYTFIVTENRDLVAHLEIDGVGETNANAFIVYPNPADDKVFVEGENIDYVELYNAMGQKLMVVNGSGKMEIDVTSFKKGVYYLRIIGNVIKSQKLIIK